MSDGRQRDRTPRSGRLLDVGCGPGTVLLPMARYVECA
jgi:hypothetical protein